MKKAKIVFLSGLLLLISGASLANDACYITAYVPVAYGTSIEKTVCYPVASRYDCEIKVLELKRQIATKENKNPQAFMSKYIENGTCEAK